MTTSAVKSLGESLRIGGRSEPRTGTGGTVIFGEFAAARALPIAGGVALQDLIDELSAKPGFAQEMRSARRQLARTVYADEPQSFSALRLAAGLSQAELAVAAGTSQSHIARIEGGTVDPGTDVIARIAAGLDADDADVFKAVRHQRASRGRQK